MSPPANASPPSVGSSSSEIAAQPRRLSIAARLHSEVGLLIAGCLCLVATNALGMTIPWLLKGAVDTLRGLHEKAGTGAEVARISAVVARAAAWIAAAAAAQAVIRTASRVLIFNAGRNVEFGLRRDLFAHLCRQDLEFFRKHPTGDVMSRLTNDLSAVRMLFGPGILNVVNTVLVYASGIWLLLHLNPRLTLISLLPYPLLIFAARLWSRRIYTASRDLQDQLGALSTTLQEDLAGIAVVKNYVLEERRHQAFARQSAAYLRRALYLARTRGSLTPLFAVIGAVGTLIVLWAGGHEVIAGRMTLGALVAFNAYLAYLSFPTIALGWILAVWQRGIAAWVRVRDLLETEPAIADAGGADSGGSSSPWWKSGPSPNERGGPAARSRGGGIPGGIATTSDAADEPRSRSGDVERLPPQAARSTARGGALVPSLSVRDLSLERDQRPILDGVSFEVPAGGSLAIVGPTGAGKTTLVDALPRLWNVPARTVFIGGRDVRDIPLRTLREMIGYAPQEAFLFSATVADNIAFGIPAQVPPEERDARVDRAVAAAGLAPDLAVLPEGLRTIVGERGITLSGGQRQRVALARAIAAAPDILVLDDSLSSVDAHTEREILTHLRPVLRGRTSILISHRVAAVREADQILVLERGRIAERGTHQALLAKGGVYATLYREQLAAEALGEPA